MQLEILQGADMYDPEQLGYGNGGQPLSAQASVPDESIPKARGEYGEIYSTKHERILLRLEHVMQMDTIRRRFNTGRLHPGVRALTTSDIVNAALDFMFEHRIPYFELREADDFKDLISKSIFRSVVSRWRQFNETFD